MKYNCKAFSRELKRRSIFMSESKLYRSRKNRMISGVCGGIAEKFNMDPTIIRLIWALLTFVTAEFPGIIIYIICAIVIPSEEEEIPIDNLKSANIDE